MTLQLAPPRALLSLGQPFRLGPLALRNRIVMAPMTREQAPEGVPSLRMADYYARRAEGGVGLIVTEGAAPNAEGRFGRDVPRLYGADALAGWEVVVRRVKAAGAAIMAQIWHVGAFEPSLAGMTDSLTLSRCSPSGLAPTGQPCGRAMSAAEITATVRSFVDAARAAQEVGFDGVEIHAAHGYLPDQFFWARTNLREDAYGGPLVQRARFAAEVVAACKASTGPGFAVTLRLSQWKQRDYLARVVDSPEELQNWLMPLVAAEVDGFHVSTRRFWEAGFAGDDASLAAWVRRLTGRPVIAVGSLLLDTDFKAETGKLRAGLAQQSLLWAAEAITAGEFDLIAAGRALLANPDLAQKVLAGRLDALSAYDKSHLDQLI